MSNRRVLANVPNAINSPYRNVASQKRMRGADDASAQPPAKRQMLEIADSNVENLDPKRRNIVSVVSHEKLDEPFSKRRSNATPTAFERKLASVREKKPAPTPQRTEQAVRGHVTAREQGENEESLRQWRRHYKRQFPGFVFYFDSVTPDARVPTARLFQLLGAREERFFSKQVTHVITTRSIPAESTVTSPDEDVKYEDIAQKTVQPSNLTQDQRKTTSLLDATLQRRTQSHLHGLSHDVELRRAPGQTVDVLSRARELGIKIWTLEKLQRVLRTILEIEDGELNAAADSLQRHAATKIVVDTTKDADLEQLLRNEKINGPADRDMTVAAQDMVSFKAYYIYIHDMDEKTKPVMVRDYEKPASREQGKWPQFRLSALGRCPFIEDPAHTKKLQQQETRAASKAEEELAMQRKTRATAAPFRVLTECEANLRRSPRKSVQQQQQSKELAKPLEPPKILPSKRQSSADGVPLFGSAQQSLRGLPRMIGGEPVASGMQHSNITSAIRSQIISSTAISSTAAGVPKRVGDSKEVSALKRKVLERGASVPSTTYSIPSSYMNDMRAAINDHDPPPRAAKRKAQETLGVVREDADEEDMQHHHLRHAQGKATSQRKRRPTQKEARPGYCENCRDKFEDFDDHVDSRKHRKYALAAENWKELDALLVKLRRPHKAT